MAKKDLEERQDKEGHLLDQRSSLQQKMQKGEDRLAAVSGEAKRRGIDLQHLDSHLHLDDLAGSDPRDAAAAAASRYPAVSGVRIPGGVGVGNAGIGQVQGQGHGRGAPASAPAPAQSSSYPARSAGASFAQPVPAPKRAAAPPPAARRQPTAWGSKLGRNQQSNHPPSNGWNSP